MKCLICGIENVRLYHEEGYPNNVYCGTKCQFIGAGDKKREAQEEIEKDGERKKGYKPLFDATLPLDEFRKHVFNPTLDVNDGKPIDYHIEHGNITQALMLLENLKTRYIIQDDKKGITSIINIVTMRFIHRDVCVNEELDDLVMDICRTNPQMLNSQSKNHSPVEFVALSNKREDLVIRLLDLRFDDDSDEPENYYDGVEDINLGELFLYALQTNSEKVAMYIFELDHVTLFRKSKYVVEWAPYLTGELLHNVLNVLFGSRNRNGSSSSVAERMVAKAFAEGKLSIVEEFLKDDRVPLPDEKNFNSTEKAIVRKYRQLRNAKLLSRGGLDRGVALMILRRAVQLDLCRQLSPSAMTYLKQLARDMNVPDQVITNWTSKEEACEYLSGILSQGPFWQKEFVDNMLRRKFALNVFKESTEFYKNLHEMGIETKGRTPEELMEEVIKMTRF